jgi:hypothetical protein
MNIFEFELSLICLSPYFDIVIHLSHSFNSENISLGLHHTCGNAECCDQQDATPVEFITSEEEIDNG